jgi:hypothetical protein
MTIRSCALAACVAAALALPAGADAFTCYVVFDRSDNVIYQGDTPPVDMSDQGAPARERMRQAGEFLMFADFESCPPVAFFTGSGGSPLVDFEKTVGGLPPVGAASGVTRPALAPPASKRPTTPPARK